MARRWNVFDRSMRFSHMPIPSSSVHIRPVDVTVLHVHACPSVTVLLERLHIAADLAGVAVTTTLRVVASEQEAIELGFSGSPTVLVDGSDPFESGGVSYGCRLYEFGGRLDGAPSMSQLNAALLVASSSHHRPDRTDC